MTKMSAYSRKINLILESSYSHYGTTMSSATTTEPNNMNTRLGALPSEVAGGDKEGGKMRKRLEGGGYEDEERAEQLSFSQSTIQEASKRLSLSPQGVTFKREFTASSSISETDGEDSSVTVAIRVRPFSQREQRLGAKQVVRMQGNETVITSGEGVIHRFSYDHCFWSFDHTQSEFANQKTVFVSLARPLLDRSFEGYNTCLFAYGQTGSGKSYCIMGEGKEEGVVPQFCRELFDRVNGSASKQISFKIQVSYYEIYKEKIYDLLASTTIKNKIRLRVREHPVMGPYVEDLSTYVASSYKDIEHWINLGNRFRATATTGMNDRSSRSHSVFTIMLTQTSVLEGEERSKVSRINLIDLAGSERSSIAQTTGDRLKEGASINRSLHTLGKVISLLSERSTGRRRKVYIPYRDSTLTWLLKDSLGGNSKTAMIATISPANIHHNESLSTLRYAHQTRTIVNVARVNEDPNARIIRDLREEILHLQQQIGAPLDTSISSQQEIRELREKLRESEKLLTESTRTWQERLSETEKRKKEELEKLKRAGTLKVNNRLPNLVNLNEDPQLSEMLLYILKDGVSTVGRAGCGSHDIQLTGALVAEDHCSIVYSDDSVVVVQPSEHPDAQTFINGSIITGSTTLHHGDRVVFGGEHFFRFNHPLEVDMVGVGSREGEKGNHDFEYARNELIRVQTEKIKAEQEQRMKEVMEAQRKEYEAHLLELGAQMEGQSMELSVVQQSREETEERVEELSRKYQKLEQETMKQKHLLQLEKLKTEKETKDMTETKTKLMSELEKEKEKLEKDIQQLTTNKQMRERATIFSTTQSTQSVTGEASLLKGAELVRLSMKLHEATIISKSLGKPLTFTREENYISEGREQEVYVRVNNTEQRQVTYWDLDKFDTRLEQMRELYTNQPHGATSVSSSSLEPAESIISTGSDDIDPFHDPSDTWYHDNLATPKASPQHHLIRSYSAASSRNSTPTTTDPLSVRRVLNLTASIPRNHHELLSMSKADSPGVSSLYSRTPHHPNLSLSQSLPRLCHDRVSKILSKQHVSEVTVFHRALQCVVDMVTATHELEDACNAHDPNHNLNIPFSETTEVRTYTLQLYVSLEQLICHAHSIFASCHMMSHVTGNGSGPLDGQSLIEETCQQLLTSLSHQTALYCNRLFANTDVEQMVERVTPGVDDDSSEDFMLLLDSCSDLRDSLDHVTGLLGRLCLAWRVLETKLREKEEGRMIYNSWIVGESLTTFLSDQDNRGLSIGFYRGHSEWSRLCMENTCYSIQSYCSTLQSTQQQYEDTISEMVASVVQLLTLIMNFLQAVAVMQNEVWGMEDEQCGEFIDDVIPNTQTVINMLLHLRQVEDTIWSLCSHIQQPSTLTITTLPSSHHLLSTTRSLGESFNQLAASTQAVLRCSKCDNVQELMTTVQRGAQATGRGVKSLTTLLKSTQQHTNHTQPPLSTEPQLHSENDKHSHKPETIHQQHKQHNLYIEADDDYV